MKPLSREAQVLIDSVRAAGEPPPAYRAHMRSRLAGALGGAASAAAVVAASAKAAAAEAAPVKGAGLGLLTKAGLTIAMLGALIGGAALLWRDSGVAPITAQPSIAAIAFALPSPVVEPSPEPASDAPAMPAASTTLEAPIPEAPRLLPRAAFPRRAIGKMEAPSPAPRPEPDSALRLNKELDLLSRAQAALSSGQAGAALALLEEHAASYPSGALREERLAARVFALCALGRKGEARAEADQFVQNAPRSPLAARVRAACPAAESQPAKPE